MSKLRFYLKTYDIISDAVSNGIGYGLNRAFKHDDSPSLESIKEVLKSDVMNSLCEVLDFEKGQPRVYEAMVEAVSSGVSFGIHMAFKHTDKPSRETIEHEVDRAVGNSLCEVIDYDKAKVTAPDAEILAGETKSGVQKEKAH